MKKISTVALVLVLSFTTLNTQAQAFEKGTRFITLGLGAANMYHIPTWGGGIGTLGAFAPITGQFSVQGEFSVHKYVGVGFNVGIGGRVNGYGTGLGYLYSYGSYYSGRAEFNIPMGVIANFHFYQLIADKSSRGSKLHADKLDVYAGVNLGTGIAIHPSDSYYSSTDFSILAWGGIQAGARYFFKPNFGVNLEIGFGKSIINAGITFKMGGGKGRGKGKG